MLIPLTEVLRLPSFRAADPDVRAGDPQSTLVRWIHSSEVYEMRSLLAGGELLLTTGLGLHARTPEQLAAYVGEIAAAGCVALALELGRSFFSVPKPMLDEAERHGLVLIALPSVVPFERMIEDFHDLVLQRTLGAQRYGEHSWDDLLAVVLAGQGLRALLDAIARSAGCVAELHDPEGQLVERSRIPTTSSTAPGVTARVRSSAGPLGTLVLRGPVTAERRSIAGRGAVAVALELTRTPGLVPSPSPAQAIVGDLAAGALAAPGEVLRRLGETGWASGGRWPGALVAAFDADPRRPIVDEIAAAEAAFGAVWGRCLVGATGTHVVVVGRGAGEPARLRAQGAQAAEALAAATGRAPLVSIARPAAEPGALPDAVRSARDVLRLGRATGHDSGVLLPRDVAVPGLLATLDRPVLSAFVAEQMGELIEHDRARGSQLVKTLDAYLAAGRSKSRAAAALGIRRQSLYARLARVESLLGVDLDDGGHLAGLSLALTAWRMRTGLDPQVAFGTGEGAG